MSSEEAAAKDTLTKSGFFGGFFSALRRVHGMTVRAKPAELHRAFHRAFSSSTLPVFRKLAEDTDYCCDPLYGHSAWLASGITQASRDLMIELPMSPGRWNDIVIRFDREEAGRRLDESGFREELVALANDFVRVLQIEQYPRGFFDLFSAALVTAGAKRWRAPREDLVPAIRHALDATSMPLAGYPAHDLSAKWLSGWMHEGLAGLCTTELIQSGSNPFFLDIAVRLVPDTAERMLARSGRREEFLALAHSFLAYLAARHAPTGMQWGAQEDPRR